MARAEIIAIVFSGVGIGDLVWIDAALLPDVVTRDTGNEVASAGLVSNASGVSATSATPRTPVEQPAVPPSASIAPPAAPPAALPSVAVAPAHAVAPSAAVEKSAAVAPSSPVVASLPAAAIPERVQVPFVQVGAAAVDGTFLGTLDGIVERLKEEENLRIIVVGHADERGSARLNWNLSKRRALAVERELVARGADAQRVDVRWFGERKPAVRGHDDAAWAANRRADVLWRRSE